MREYLATKTKCIGKREIVVIQTSRTYFHIRALFPDRQLLKTDKHTKQTIRRVYDGRRFIFHS